MSIADSEYYRYLTVSARDKQWGLYVTGAGSASIPPGSPYPITPHPELYQFTWPQRRVLLEYQVVCITRGQGQFESEAAGEHRIAADSVLLTFPGDWHRYRPTPAVGWDEYWVGFNGEDVDRLVQRGFFSPENPVLQTGSDETVRHAFQTVLSRVRLQPPGYQQLIAADVMEILGAALAADRVGSDGDHFAKLINRAKRLLESDKPKLSTMDELAASLFLSAAQFRRVFKRHTGMSPYQYYYQTRINRAQELLCTTTLSVKKIAALLHFENPYHFSNAFKNKTGKSPSQWRKLFHPREK